MPYYICYNYRMFLRKYIVIGLVVLVLMSSCVVTEELTEKKDMSGVSRTDLEIKPVFTAILNDLATFSDDDDMLGTGFFNLAAKLSCSKSASNVFVFTGKEENRYILSFDYISLENLLMELNDGKNNTLFDCTENSLSFNLDMDNYAELKKVIPILSDENFEVYGPEYSNGMTEDEYLEMISFLLGDDTPEALKESSVTVNITVPGKITKYNGVEKAGNNTAVFSFSVIDFLLLNEPLAFSISWK